MRQRRTIPNRVSTFKAQREAYSRLEKNRQLAEDIQGYAILMETKNVALVDISEYTKGDDNG